MAPRKPIPAWAGYLGAGLAAAFAVSYGRLAFLADRPVRPAVFAVLWVALGVAWVYMALRGRGPSGGGRA